MKGSALSEFENSEWRGRTLQERGMGVWVTIAEGGVESGEDFEVGDGDESGEKELWR
jgi:hypothetical protein